MATKHTMVEEDLVLSVDSTMEYGGYSGKKKAILALMNIQALSHLDLQGTAMIPMIFLVKVLVTRK